MKRTSMKSYSSFDSCYIYVRLFELMLERFRICKFYDVTVSNYNEMKVRGCLERTMSLMGPLAYSVSHLERFGSDLMI